MSHPISRECADTEATMMIRPLALIGFLSFSIVACGREPAQTSRPAATAAAPAGTSTPGALASTAGAPKQAVEETSAEAARAQEAGADSTSESRGDTALERLAALTPEQQLPAGKWKVGTNYIPLLPAQPT